ERENARGHEDGAYRVDVAQRIERYAPGKIGRGVTEVARHVAVGSLVQGDCQQHRDCPDGQGGDQRIHYRPVSKPRILQAERLERTASGADQLGRTGSEIDHRSRLRTAIAGLDDQIDELAEAVADLLRIGHRQLLTRSEEHTSELQSRENLVCRLLLEKKKGTVGAV